MRFLKKLETPVVLSVLYFVAIFILFYGDYASFFFGVCVVWGIIVSCATTVLLRNSANAVKIVGISGGDYEKI